jgi:hypothetical protein
MGVTKALDGGAVWGANQVTTSTTVTPNVTNGAAVLTNYPVSNLKNPLRTKTTRVTYDDSDDTFDIVFDFGTAVSVTAIAFVDWNVPNSSNLVKIYADADNTSWDGPRWDIFPYQGDNGVARYYLDTASDGAAISSARYWKIAFSGDYSIVESYLEIGEIVFASYIDVDISTPFGRTVQNPSTYATSYGGQEYVDEKNFFNAIALNTTPMNSTSLYTLQNSIAAVGSAHTILDVHASDAGIGDTASSTQGILNLASTYYGRLHKGIKTSIKGFNNSTLSLSFGEARK